MLFLLEVRRSLTFMLQYGPRTLHSDVSQGQQRYSCEGGRKDEGVDVGSVPENLGHVERAKEPEEITMI